MNELLDFAVVSGNKKYVIDLLGKTSIELSADKALSLMRMLIDSIHSSEPERFYFSGNIACLDFRANGCKSPESQFQITLDNPKSQIESLSLCVPEHRTKSDSSS